MINEAVEIAKAYGTDESSRFVNGVLGRVARSGAEIFVDPDEPGPANASSGEDA